MSQTRYVLDSIVVPIIVDVCVYSIKYLRLESWEAGMQGGLKAGRLESWEAGMLGGWEAGKLEGLKAGN
jgi:hypothetical protein